MYYPLHWRVNSTGGKLADCHLCLRKWEKSTFNQIDAFLRIITFVHVRSEALSDSRLTWKHLNQLSSPEFLPEQKATTSPAPLPSSPNTARFSYPNIPTPRPSRPLEFSFTVTIKTHTHTLKTATFASDLKGSYLTKHLESPPSVTYDCRAATLITLTVRNNWKCKNDLVIFVLLASAFCWKIK